MNETYNIPRIPTARIVIEPNAYWSAPVHVDGFINSPSPFVETYHTKYAEVAVMSAMNPTITPFTCLGRVLPVE